MESKSKSTKNPNRDLFLFSTTRTQLNSTQQTMSTSSSSSTAAAAAAAAAAATATATATATIITDGLPQFETEEHEEPEDWITSKRTDSGYAVGVNVFDAFAGLEEGMKKLSEFTVSDLKDNDGQYVKKAFYKFASFFLAPSQEERGQELQARYANAVSVKRQKCNCEQAFSKRACSQAKL